MNAAKTLLCAHDAGGANILAAWARMHPDPESLLAVLDGPAKAIFARIAPSVAPAEFHDLETLAPARDMVLCATSWACNLERRVLARAGDLGLHRAAFLDHWLNYRTRFDASATWPQSLPEEIWVGDSYALDIARTEGFPEQRLRLVPNPYHALLRDEFTRMAAAPHDGTHLLYLSEIVAAHALKVHGSADAWGYTEQGQMRGFLDALPTLAGTVSRVRVRLHPAEALDAYDGLLASRDMVIPVEVSQGGNLLEDLVWCDAAVGMESEALAVALDVARKPAVSCLPTGARACRLPHEGIARICDFKQLAHHLQRG
ncbi:MAG: hypothetical protein FD177_1417 [Desulfovibrionaceae bacterium]|nr:MAG: hypothetical protein FD177_1417 [Desulfovibrionaceae bacterium]